MQSQERQRLRRSGHPDRATITGSMVAQVAIAAFWLAWSVPHNLEIVKLTVSRTAVCACAPSSVAAVHRQLLPLQDPAQQLWRVELQSLRDSNKLLCPNTMLPGLNLMHVSDCLTEFL